MSKTRQRFQAKKKARRKQRADDAYEAAHSFWCKGLIEGRNGLKECKWQVMFRHKAEFAKAVCRRCGQLHIYGSPMTSNGPASERWMTVEQAAESVLPAESVETVETPEGKEIKLVDHAAWCSDRSKALYGCRGVWQGPGKVAWYMSCRRGVWHLCQSTLAAQYVRSYGKQ
jgi:hypothetical protein